MSDLADATPCPFCGSTIARTATLVNGIRTSVQVTCCSCGACGPSGGQDMAEAAQRWGKREGGPAGKPCPIPEEHDVPVFSDWRVDAHRAAIRFQHRDANGKLSHFYKELEIRLAPPGVGAQRQRIMLREFAEAVLERIGDEPPTSRKIVHAIRPGTAGPDPWAICGVRPAPSDGMVYAEARARWMGTDETGCIACWRATPGQNWWIPRDSAEPSRKPIAHACRPDADQTLCGVEPKAPDWMTSAEVLTDREIEGGEACWKCWQASQGVFVPRVPTGSAPLAKLEASLESLAKQVRALQQTSVTTVVLEALRTQLDNYDAALTEAGQDLKGRVEVLENGQRLALTDTTSSIVLTSLENEFDGLRQKVARHQENLEAIQRSLADHHTKLDKIEERDRPARRIVHARSAQGGAVCEAPLTDGSGDSTTAHAFTPHRDERACEECWTPAKSDYAYKRRH